MNAFVGSAALAGASIVPNLRAEAFAEPLSIESASAELGRLAAVLDDATEALLAASAAYDETRAKIRAWEKRNREPSNAGGRRLYRKWAKRYNQHLEEISFDETFAKYQSARDCYNRARFEVASYEPRDLQEILVKSCLSIAFENASKPAIRHAMEGCELVAHSVARDILALHLKASSKH